MIEKYENIIKKIRKRIEDDVLEDQPYTVKGTIKHIDNFLKSSEYSDLEKAFYLFLNQFPSDHQPYIVHPKENILVENVYDYSEPYYEYEIDFALYAGTIKNYVKIGIECDGLRSHSQRYSDRDRRKDINLQAAGWITMRFNSKEIHKELEQFEKEDLYISEIITNIQNIIDRKLDLITWNNFVRTNIRNELTGYKWGFVECTHCGFSQLDILNHKKITCRECKRKYVRKIGKDENIQYEHNGLIIFKEAY